MAHKKGGGSSKNGRDSNPKMLGIKVYDGQAIRAGGIIVRQRGSRWTERFNVARGRDFTLYALVDGVVKFESARRVSVYPPSRLPAAAPGNTSPAARPEPRSAAAKAAPKQT